MAQICLVKTFTKKILTEVKINNLVIKGERRCPILILLFYGSTPMIGVGRTILYVIKLSTVILISWQSRHHASEIWGCLNTSSGLSKITHLGFAKSIWLPVDRFLHGWIKAIIK